MIKKCVICEAEFEAKTSITTCSEECRIIRKRAAKRAEQKRYFEKYPWKKKEQQQRYYAKPDKRNNKRQKDNARAAKNRAEALENNPEKKSEIEKRVQEMKEQIAPKMKECVECGKEFQAKNNVKTCSDVCWLVRYKRQRCRPEKNTVPEERLRKKRDAANLSNAEKRAALKIVKILQTADDPLELLKNV